jgi:Flp pilus assembly protein TadD
LLRRAIVGDPRQVTGYALLVRVLQAQNRLDAAATEFDEMGRGDPTNVAARLMSAVIVHTTGDARDAERRYRDVLAIEPNAAVAANNLAALLLERGEDLASAEQLATTAVEQAPNDAEVLDTLGSIYYKRARYGLAIKHLEQAVAIEPDNALFHYHLGLAYAGGADPDRASDALRQAVRLNPRLAGARDALASLSTR